MKIDHEYTRNIVCPYCGYEDIDSWEIEPSEEDLGLQMCGSCEKEFYAYRNITVDYTTKKATYGKCKLCGSEDVVVEDYHSCIGKYDSLCHECGYKERRRMEIEYFDTLK